MKYILGYGIAGAVMKYFAPDMKVVSDQFDGATMKMGLMDLGPRYIYYSDRVAKLLDELGLDSSTRDVKVQYLVDGLITDKLSDSIVSRYNMKVRGTGNNVQASMSSGMKSFTVFNTSQTQLFDELRRRLNKEDCIKAKTLDLSPGLQIMSLEGVSRMNFSFDRAVCTLPLPALKRMPTVGNEIKYNFISKDVYFLQIDEQALSTFGVSPKEFDEAEILYVVDKNINLYRISRIFSQFSGDPIYVGESVTPLERAIKVPFAKIANPKRFERIGADVFLLGRFAQWDNKMRTREVIERAENLAKTI